MTSPDVSGWLHNAIKYCARVRKHVRAVKESNNSATVEFIHTQEPNDSDSCYIRKVARRVILFCRCDKNVQDRYLFLDSQRSITTQIIHKQVRKVTQSVQLYCFLKYTTI